MELQLQKDQVRLRPHNLRANGPDRWIHTTLGDLVAALSEVAFEVCGDTRQAYLLAGLALEAILGEPHWNNVRLEPAPIRIPVRFPKGEAGRKGVKIKAR